MVNDTLIKANIESNHSLDWKVALYAWIQLSLLDLIDGFYNLIV